MTSRLAPLLALALFGCGSRESDLPPLHKVTGRVLKNGQPVSGGAVRFEMVDAQDVLIVTGDVDTDGRFELKTVKGRTRVPGAPEGTYRVTYSPPQVGRDALPVTSKETYRVEAKDNELTFEIGGGKAF